MPQLHKVVLQWQGAAIKGNAVSVLHYDANSSAAPPAAAIQAAFQGAASLFPSGTTITVPAEGDVIDDTNGHLTGSWTEAQANTATGSGSGPVAAGVGACISLGTSTIVNGKKGPRRLRGRIFLVPLITGAYDTDGTLTSGALGGLQTLANSLLSAGPLSVWHRPTTVGGVDGSSGHVTTVTVHDKVAMLKSRRD